MDDSLVTIVLKRSLERATLQDADLTGGAGAAESVTPVPLACPECGGTLWEVRHGELRNYRCQVGHRYSDDGLLTAQSERLEAALWAATRALEEQAAMLLRLAARSARDGRQIMVRRYEEQATLLREQADTVRNVAETLAAPVSPVEESLLTDG